MKYFHGNSSGSILSKKQFELTRSTTLSRPQCLRILGLTSDCGTDEIEAAYNSLVSDITPGDGAKHSKVAAAKQLLAEVELAYRQLAV